MSLEAAWADAERVANWTTASIIGARNRAGGLGSIPASTAWPTANQAFLIPFVLSGPATIVKLFFQAGTTPGTTNYDLGIYDEGFHLLGSLGATAAVSTTDAILPVGGGTLATPLSLTRGRFYLAMSSASAALTVRAIAPGNQVPRAFGLQTMATAHPLPATVTPASMGTTNFIPQLGMSVSSTIL
jgi:hypothetical protein